MIPVIVGIFGLLIGSFLNVVVWRVPRHESVVMPGSHCPGCDAELSAFENIPVLSWLALRGKCRHCGVRISVRYPLVELANAVLWVGLAVHFGHSWELPAYCALTSGLLALSLIDLEHFLLPNRVLYPTGIIMSGLLVLPAAIDGRWDDLLRAGLAGVTAFAVFFVIHIISPRGMGFGDVRLSFVLGIALGWLSWGHVFLGLFLGFLLGAVVGAFLIVTKLRTRKEPVPFGPFMSSGALIAIFAGTQILDLYAGR